jgi:effector-binding domain-containing protein
MTHETTTGYRIETVTLHDEPTLVVRGTVDAGGAGTFVGEAFSRVARVAGGDGMHIAGPPFARVHPNDDGTLDVEAGFPVSGVALGQGEVKVSHLPGGSALRTVHRGDYGAARLALEALHAYATEHHLTPTGDAWEVYLDTPDVPQPRTIVVLPTRAAGDAALAAGG